MKKKYLFPVFYLLFINHVFPLSAAGKTLRVLFLGNSYTYVNDLPLMTANLALSNGDSLIYDSNMPGGYTFQNHSLDNNSLGKIMLGNWDYVVLQEQSQRPSFPIGQVITDVFPYARFLDSMITHYNPCAETIFYMTWGRKNGDASNCISWPPVCTYNGMDSLLHLRYMMMADSNNAEVSPVGAVWKHIRQNFPLIELYQADESHPSVSGSYAAACSFYSALFRSDPSQSTYTAGIDSTDALHIRLAAKTVVFDSLLNWHIGEYDPLANFTYSITGVNEVSFINQSLQSGTISWYFGDGDSSALSNPVHTYLATGTYSVMLIAKNCEKADTLVIQVNSYQANVDEHSKPEITLYPNPSGGSFKLLFPKRGILNSIKLFNSNGQILLNKLINSNLGTYTFNENLSPGFYFIELYFEHQLQAIKFTIK